MLNPFDPGLRDGRAADLRLRAGGRRRAHREQLYDNRAGPKNVAIGDQVRIDGSCSIIGSGFLEIGNRVHIHSYCQIGACGGVTLGDYVGLARGCLVYSASDDPLGKHMVGGVVPEWATKPKLAPVHFKRHSAAFRGCTILPGVTFKEGVVACLHSLVTTIIAEWTIVAGAPAVHRLHRSRRLLLVEATMSDADAASVKPKEANRDVTANANVPTAGRTR